MKVFAVFWINDRVKELVEPLCTTHNLAEQVMRKNFFYADDTEKIYQNRLKLWEVTIEELEVKAD